MSQEPLSPSLSPCFADKDTRAWKRPVAMPASSTVASISTLPGSSSGPGNEKSLPSWETLTSGPHQVSNHTWACWSGLSLSLVKSSNLPQRALHKGRVRLLTAAPGSPGPDATQEMPLFRSLGSRLFQRHIANWVSQGCVLLILYS